MSVNDNELVQAAAAETVQNLPDADGAATAMRFFGLATRGPLLPPWGTPERERALRNIYHNDFNWIIRSAFAGVMTMIATTPWQIRGPRTLGAAEQRLYAGMVERVFRKQANGRPDLDYWQAVLRTAHFGRGWNDFVRMGVDYLRHDVGWFIEIIAPGDPNEPPTGPVVGLAHLDALRCFPTGDPEYPVQYLDGSGKYHRLHRARVLNLQDMPDHDEARPGYGSCALSRAVTIANRSILMEQYNTARLDDKPPPGIVVASNISKQERDAAYRAMLTEQSMSERAQWGRQLWFYGLDAQTPAKIETMTFQQTPEGWDYVEWVEVSVKQLAMALGVDIQELWELTGGNIGTATQSAILHAKSRGKTIGNLRTAIERALNAILPEPYEFAFSFTDYEQDLQVSQVASTWTAVAAQIGTILGERTAAQLLLNTVGEIRDAHQQALNPQQATADDVDVGAEPETLQAQVEEEDDTELSERRLHLGGRHDADMAAQAEAQKAIQATRLKFEDTLGPLFAAAARGEISARRLGVILRAELRRYGTMVFLDGARDGGLEIDRIEDEEDKQTFRQWLIEQSAYVSQMTAKIRDSSIDPYDRVKLWWNKSMMPLYQEGAASADRNGLYEWVLGDTREHCKDCLYYNGQRHRLKQWISHGILPQHSDLECGGWFCKCKLVKVTGKSRGRFRSPAQGG